MNSAARKAYERDARLNRWAAWAGLTIASLTITATSLVVLGTMWFCVALAFTF